MLFYFFYECINCVLYILRTKINKNRGVLAGDLALRLVLHLSLLESRAMTSPQRTLGLLAAGVAGALTGSLKRRGSRQAGTGLMAAAPR